MIDELKWIAREIGAAMLFILLITALGVSIGLRINYEGCQQYERMTGRQTDWGILVGCVVSVDGVNYTQEEYRAIITAREGLRDE